MSLLRWKQKLFADGGVARGGGGGGGSSAPASPTQTTVQNTNIPDYAQPYVSNMLNATQSQLFQTDSSGNISGFQPYTPYSSNPADYVAGFSPLQQQAQSSAANLQTPGQFGMATGTAARGTMQALGAGQQLQNQLTNPNAMAAYMNPYLQNTLAPAEQLLNQQYGIAGQQQQGQATQSGAFGGSRNALQQSLNQQNQMLAQNQLVGNAYNQAYQNAQQQAQNVANMGLQGAQAGISGANTLAGIGGQQLAAQQGIIGTQASQGAAQQQQQQQIINQAVQNYATAQQYPLLQLGTMSNMLRGLPMQASTTSLYQAQPTTTQQAIGLGGTAAALMAATGKREGGIIGMRKGGKVPGYKYGAVINDPKLEDDARVLGAQPSQPGQPSALQQRINDPQVTPSEKLLFQGVQADQDRLRQNTSAAQMLQQAGQVPQMAQPQQPNPAMMDQARLSGLGGAGGQAFNAQGYAGGGILAFNGEDDEQLIDQTMYGAPDEALPPTNLSTKAPKKTKAPVTGSGQPTTPEEFAAARQSMMAARGFGPGMTPEEKAYAESQQTRGSDKTLNRNLMLQLAGIASEFGSTPSPGGLMAAANKSIAHHIPGIAAAYDAQEAAQQAGLKASSDLSQAQRKFAAGDVDEAWKDYDSYEKNKSAEKVANIHAAAAGQTARESTELIKQLQAQGYSLPDAIGIVKGYNNRSDANNLAAIRYADAALNNDTRYLALSNSKKPEDQAAAKQMRDSKIAEYRQAAGGQQQPTAAAPQPTNPDAGGIVDVPGKGKFQLQPNGNYIKIG